MTSKKWILLLLFPICGALLYTVATADLSSTLHWIDGLTYSSLLLFMCGGVLLVYNGRFFRAFWDSCKRFYATFFKKEMYVREQEGRHNSVQYRKEVLPHRPVLLVAACSFLISLLLSLLYVQS